MFRYLDTCTHPELVTLPMNIFRYTYTETGTFMTPHCHVQLEVLYAEAGRMTVTVNGAVYHLAPGDLILFNPFDTHAGFCAEQEGGCSYLCLALTMEHLGAYPRSVLWDAAQETEAQAYRFDAYYPSDAADTPLLGACMTEMYDAFHGKTCASECRMLAACYRMLSLLFGAHYHENAGAGKRDTAFIRQVQTLVGERYRAPLSSSDMSGALYMTTSRFCQMFRANFGTSFHAYLSQYRVQRAKELLGKHMTVSDIAAAVGFSDYCHFSRCFHKLTGMAPAVFFGRRKQP